jgi:Asp/Glu/hydantoin racemase
MRLAFIHAALASLPALRRGLAQHPDWDVVNLLDDGLQRFFADHDDLSVEARLRDMVRAATSAYHARAVLATCSAARLDAIERIAEEFAVPFLKIDYPMCQSAVRAAQRIGVVVSFPPTEAVTIGTLAEAAIREGRAIHPQTVVVAEALTLLNAGDRATHDRLLTEAAVGLRAQGVETIVLAQVSMSHLAEPLAQQLGIPVWDSLSTSFAELDRLLGGL